MRAYAKENDVKERERWEQKQRREEKLSHALMALLQGKGIRKESFTIKERKLRSMLLLENN